MRSSHSTHSAAADSRNERLIKSARSARCRTSLVEEDERPRPTAAAGEPISDLRGLTRSDVDVSITEVISGSGGYVWLSAAGIRRLPGRLMAEAERRGCPMTPLDAQAAVAYLIALAVLVADEDGRVPLDAAEGWSVDGNHAGYCHELPGGKRWGWARKLFTEVVRWVGLRAPSAGGDGARLDRIEERIWAQLHAPRPTKERPASSEVVPVQRGELRRLCKVLNHEFTNPSRREHKKMARELYRVVDLLTGVVDDFGLLDLTGEELAERWGCSTGKVSDTRRWMLKHGVLVAPEGRRPRHTPKDLAERQRTLPSALAAYQALTGRSLEVRLRDRERPTVDIDVSRPVDHAFTVRTGVPSQSSGSKEVPCVPTSVTTPLPTSEHGDARAGSSRGRGRWWICSPKAMSKRQTRKAVEYLQRNARDAERLIAMLDDRQHGAVTRWTLRDVIAAALHRDQAWRRTGEEPTDDLKEEIEAVSRLVRRLHTISRDSAMCQPDELQVAFANPDDGPDAWRLPDNSVDIEQLVAVLTNRLEAQYDYAMSRRTGRQQGLLRYSETTTHVSAPGRHELGPATHRPEPRSVEVDPQSAETAPPADMGEPIGRMKSQTDDRSTVAPPPSSGSTESDDRDRRLNKRPWMGRLDGFVDGDDLGGFTISLERGR